ncbi:MAG: hypothetical protein K6U03_06740 [Firmicutes bacterium]|nr:hypothetical protein [Bacillota bacterium]
MEEELDLRELIRPLWRRRWLILGLALAAGIAGYIGSKLSTPIYETRAKILVVPKKDTDKILLLDRETAGLSIISELGAMPQIQMANYVEILKSRTLLLAVAEELGLPTDQAGFKKLQARLTVQPIQGTGTIEIRVQDEDPRRAQQIANTLVKLFLARLLRENQEEARQAREFIEEQLEAVGSRLNRLEAELAKASNKAELPRLKQEKASTEALYTLLLTKKSEMEIAEHMRMADVRLIDPAYLPPKDDPVKPRTGLNVAVALFLGLFLGVGLAYLLEYVEPQLKTGEEHVAARD